MKILQRLRWKLTMSYTIVTVGAFLVVVLLSGLLGFNQLFIPENSLNLDQIVYEFMGGYEYKSLEMILSHQPIDKSLINEFLKNPQSIINARPLFQIGAIRLTIQTNATVQVFVVGKDGILLGYSYPGGAPANSSIGEPFDPSEYSGLSEPFKAALAGKTAPSLLVNVLEPDERFVFAGPLFNRTKGMENQVEGVIVVLLSAIPTQKDIPIHILRIMGISLAIFLLGAGLMGAIFGYFFAHGLDMRFKHISTNIDAWSNGDFSSYIDDRTGDEISQFSLQLNHMAQQLQNLLRRRQDMAVSEERNRLARDLHDSAKQQALAASLELGAGITLFDRDPRGARKHLLQADQLVDSVRKELTTLVDELRPQQVEGKDFLEILRTYTQDWSQRSGIGLKLEFTGNSDLPLGARVTLYRIVQEALANIARHSHASQAEISLDYRADEVILKIMDNGQGFDVQKQYSGLGLDSMRDRAESYGGSFVMESILGQGTQMLVTLQIENESRWQDG